MGKTRKRGATGGQAVFVVNAGGAGGESWIATHLNGEMPTDWSPEIAQRPTEPQFLSQTAVLLN